MKGARGVVLFLVWLPALLSAQEIGLSASKLFTENYELQSPPGYALHIALHLSRRFQIRIEYNYHRNKREYLGRLITGFISVPPEQNPVQVIQSISKIRSYEFSGLIRAGQTSGLTIYIGPGLLNTRLDGKRTGDSTQETISLLGEEKWGLTFSILIESRPIASTPFFVHGNVKLKHLLGGSLATDVEQPFAGSIDFLQFQVGLGVRFF